MEVNDWIYIKDKDIKPYREEIINNKGQIRNVQENVKNPYECFNLFINNGFINNLVDKTNKCALYKASKKKIENGRPKPKVEWKNIYYSDMEKFIGVIILMGIYKLEEYKENYFKEALGSLELFLPKENYELILNYLYPSNLELKGKEKIFNLIKEIMLKSQKYFCLGTYVNISERLKCGKSKENNYDYHLYALSDYNTGYTYDLILIDKDITQENIPDNIILKTIVFHFFMNKIKTNKHLLVTDKSFSLEKILKENSFNYIGTIKKEEIKCKNKEEIFKPLENGKHENYYKIEGDKYFILTKYMDNNELHFLIRNCYNSSKILNRYTWDKQKKKFIKNEYPEIFEKYNNLMKGVEFSRKLIFYYEIRQKTNKWWKKILFNLIDISLVNSFILYKIGTNNKNITQKQYRIEILKAMVYKYSLKLPQNIHIKKNNSSYMGKHLIIITKNRACAYCKLNKEIIGPKIHITSYFCSLCKVNLCRECFEKYHKMKFHKDEHHYH